MKTFERYSQMNKLLAALIATVFATGVAFAQDKKPEAKPAAPAASAAKKEDKKADAKAAAPAASAAKKDAPKK